MSGPSKIDKKRFILLGVVSGVFLIFFLVFATFVIRQFKSGAILPERNVSKSLSAFVDAHRKDFSLSFENKNELHLFIKSNGFHAEISPDHATEGKYALLAEYVKGSPFPGLLMETYGRYTFDWSNNDYLQFDAVNPNDWKVELQVKLKSGEVYPKKSFEKTINLPAGGAQTIRIYVSDLAKQIDVQKISYLNFFLVNPAETTILYFDNFKTVQKNIASSVLGVSGEVKAEYLTLRIDPSKVIKPINRMIYGSNLHPKMEFEMDVAKFGKDIGITNMRFPGGGSEGYHWKTGKADFSDRANEAPLSKIDNVTKITDIAGAKLVLQINVESGTPLEAAEWVDYMNHKSGHRVEYWELGNENYGDWSRAGYMTGEQYAKIVQEYSIAMKAVDPTIKVGASFGDANYDIFNRALVKNAADFFDFASYHWYPNHTNGEHVVEGRSHPTPEEVMANSLAVPDVISYFNRMLQELAPDRKGKIEVAFLEWDGSWDAAPSDLNYSYQGMMWSLANAIFYADALGQFATQGINVACQYSFQEVMFGLIRGWDQQAGWGGSRWDGETVRPKALALKLFANYFGDQLILSELKGSPVYYKDRDWRADSYTGDVPYVTAYASKFSKENKVAIVLINKHATQDFKTKIDLDGVDPRSEGGLWVLNGPDLSAQNDGSPGQVKIEHFTMKKIGKSFFYMVPAHSVSLLEINLEEDSK